MATKTYTYANDRGVLTLTINVQSQSETANTSNVAWTLGWSRGSNKEFYNEYNTGWTVTGNISASGTWKIPITATSVQLGSGTFSVAHNNDGTKTINVAFNVALKSPAEATGTQTLTVTLPTIARASTVTITGTPVTIDGSSKLTATINSASTAFTHTLIWKLGTRTYTQTDVINKADFTPPVEWLDQISDIQAVGTLTVTTLSNGTQIGTPTLVNWVGQTATGGLTCDIVVTQTGNSTAISWGIYVQSQSGVKVELKNFLSEDGATLAAWEISINDGRTDTGTTTPAVYSIDKITVAGTRTFSIKLVDNHGRISSFTKTITVVAWEPPKIVSASAVRADNATTPNPTGTAIRTLITWAISSVNNKNSVVNKQVKTGKNGAAWSTNSTVIASGTPQITNTGVSLADEWAAMWIITDQFGTTYWPSDASAPAASTQRVPASMMPVSVYRATATGKMGVALGDIAGDDDIGRVRSAWPHFFAEPIRPGTTTNTVLGAGSLRYNSSTDHLELLDSGGQWDQIAETVLTTTTPTFSAASGWTITLDGYWQHSDSHQAFLRVLMSCSSAIAAGSAINLSVGTLNTAAYYPIRNIAEIDQNGRAIALITNTGAITIRTAFVAIASGVSIPVSFRIPTA